MSNRKDVEAINREEGIALFDDGTMMYVDDWYDDSGDECAPKDASFCVIRDDETWGYWNVDLSKFEKARTQ